MFLQILPKQTKQHGKILSVLRSGGIALYNISASASPEREMFVYKDDRVAVVLLRWYSSTLHALYGCKSGERADFVRWRLGFGVHLQFKREHSTRSSHFHLPSLSPLSSSLSFIYHAVLTSLSLTFFKCKCLQQVVFPLLTCFPFGLEMWRALTFSACFVECPGAISMMEMWVTL